MGTITQYPFFVAELGGGGGGSCWEHEIQEEREEGKSERVPEGGWKEELKKGEEEKVEGKEQGIEEREKRRRREREGHSILHTHTCASCRHSVATLCVSSLRTKSSATSNTATTS